MGDSQSEFSSWLIAEMEARGWNNSDLARCANLSPSTISNVINRQKRPGLEFCTGVAEAFGMPPEHVMGKAGLLPVQSTDSQMLVEAQYLFSRLSDEDQERFLAMMRAMLELERRRSD